MKKFYKYISIVFILILFLINFNIDFASASSYSSSEIIMEVNTNRVLHSVNASEKKYMASTTKILTAIAIIENMDVDKEIIVEKSTTGVEGSSIYLEAGEELTIKDLLYGLMLRSGNDCAETLAVACSGSIEKFATLMNDTAQKIGATNSNFVNPHGLHNDEHYTTAYDLALISCYAIKNPIFKEIVSTKKIKIPFTTRNYDRLLINKNKMLNEFEGSTGIKTGFTKKAGRCLVSSCERNGMELVCVVLNCPPMFERSKNLLKETFTKFNNYKLIESDHIIDFIPIKESGNTCGIYVKNDIVLPLSVKEKENIDIKINCPTILEKGVKKDTEIGFVEIFASNNLIFKEKVYTIIDTD